MNRPGLLLCALLVGALATTACGKDEAPAKPRCVQGRSLGCSCMGGKSGAQVCRKDGTFGPCECTVDDRAALPQDAQERVAKQVRRLRRMRSWKRQRHAIGRMLAKANKRRAMATTPAEVRAAKLAREEILAIVTELAKPPPKPDPAPDDAGVAAAVADAGLPKPVVRLPKVCRKDPNGRACQEATLKGTP